jgi:hypothetical protein
MTLYGKDEIDDLRPSEKSILKKAIDAERRARRGPLGAHHRR